jgi:hypothetical protein
MTTTTMTWQSINADQLTAADLRAEAEAEIADGGTVDAARCWVGDHAEALQVAFCSRSGRAGVSAGAAADWTDAADAADAVRRYLSGEMIS